jgi:hypothetical protein
MLSKLMCSMEKRLKCVLENPGGYIGMLASNTYKAGYCRASAAASIVWVIHGTLQAYNGREGGGVDFRGCRHSVLRKYGQVGGALKQSRPPFISKLGVIYEVH